MPRSRAIRLGLLVAFVAAAVVSFASISVGVSRKPQRAVPGEPTYRLSNLSIEYPYEEKALDGYKVDKSKAGVSYNASLATAQLVGDVRCVLEVQDASGVTVGSTVFQLEILGTDARSHDPIPVAVTAEPSSATGYCGAPESAPKVSVGNLGINPAGAKIGDRAHLVADVSWDGSAAPGEQFCVASLQDGADQVDIKLTFDPPLAPGTTDIALLNDDFVGAEPLGLSCQPVAGLDLDVLVSGGAITRTRDGS